MVDVTLKSVLKLSYLYVAKIIHNNNNIITFMIIIMI